MFKRKKKKNGSSPTEQNAPQVIMGKSFTKKDSKNSKIEESGFLNNGSPAANMMKKLLNKENSKLDAELSGKGFKRYNNQNFEKTSIDLLGYKGLTNDKHKFLILANDFNETSGYAEMLRIQGTSLSDLPEDLIYRTLSDFINYLRAYLEEFKFVSLPLPNDSRKQQHQWAMEYQKIQSSLLNKQLNSRQRKQLLSRLEYISEILEQFKEIDLNLINQGFVLIIFGKNVKELLKARRSAFTLGSQSLNLTPMSTSEKEVFLKRMNNPNIVTS